MKKFTCYCCILKQITISTISYYKKINSALETFWVVFLKWNFISVINWNKSDIMQAQYKVFNYNMYTSRVYFYRIFLNKKECKII